VAFIGEIRAVAFTFAPVGWMMCAGQLLAISDFPDLYQLLGTTYGGDGVSTFGLPDLQGRVPLHQGQGPTLSNYVMGAIGGAEAVALALTQLPMHAHGAMVAMAGGASTTDPSGYLASGGPALYAGPGGSGAGTLMTLPAGSGQAHDNMQPSMTMTYIIAADPTLGGFTFPLPD
jgi:microcystin-dependent protein